jgi:hypothetical protein
MVSYRWVCKPDFNINNENYGQELSEFRIHGSVHRDSILIRSNKMQQYAGIYLLQIYSTCFGCPSHQSSGVHKIVNAASGTGHIT